MYLKPSQTIIIILSIALGTMITRFLPFLIFPENKKVPIFIEYLGKVLPFSVIGLLVVYCLKGISITSAPFGIPEFISIISIIVIHKWKDNTLLSISIGTIIYMILVQLFF